MIDQPAEPKTEEQERAEDRRVIAAATVGPWEDNPPDEDDFNQRHEVVGQMGGAPGRREKPVIVDGARGPDAVFIVRARKRWELTLDALEVAEREQAEAEKMRDHALAHLAGSDDPLENLRRAIRATAEVNQEINTLRAERDEARRDCCEALHDYQQLFTDERPVGGDAQTAKEIAVEKYGIDVARALFDKVKG